MRLRPPSNSPNTGASHASAQRKGVKRCDLSRGPRTPEFDVSCRCLLLRSRNAGRVRHAGFIPASADAVLVGLSAASLPMVRVLALIMRAIAQRRRLRREALVANTQGQTLVYLPSYPTVIYRRDGAQVQILWNSDGLVVDDQTHSIPLDAHLGPFDADHFIAHGTP